MRKSDLNYFLITSILILFIISILIWRSYDPNVHFQGVMKAYNKNYKEVLGQDSVQANTLHSGQISFLEGHFSRFLTQLRKIKPEKLKALHQKEWNETNKFIAQQMQYLVSLRQDPSLYDIGEVLKSILINKEITLKNRLQLIENQLQYTKQYYSNAKTNLTMPDSAKLQPAIQQQLQTLHFLQQELLDSLGKVPLSVAQHDTFLAHTTQAQLAVKDYIAFCRSILFEYQDSMFVK